MIPALSNQREREAVPDRQITQRLNRRLNWESAVKTTTPSRTFTECEPRNWESAVKTTTASRTFTECEPRNWKSAVKTTTASRTFTECEHRNWESAAKTATASGTFTVCEPNINDRNVVTTKKVVVLQPKGHLLFALYWCKHSEDERFSIAGWLSSSLLLFLLSSLLCRSDGEADGRRAAEGGTASGWEERCQHLRGRTHRCTCGHLFLGRWVLLVSVS